MPLRDEERLKYFGILALISDPIGSSQEILVVMMPSSFPGLILLVHRSDNRLSSGRQALEATCSRKNR